jgi:hypothetical protein
MDSERNERLPTMNEYSDLLAEDIVADIYRKFADGRPFAAMDQLLGALDSTWAECNFSLGDQILQKLELPKLDTASILAAISIIKLVDKSARTDTMNLFVQRGAREIQERDPARAHELLNGLLTKE